MQPAPVEALHFSTAELGDLVAPIALYPDDLLGIVLPASTYPLQVVQAARFLEALDADPTLKPDPAWDESIVALLNYPEVIALMDKDLDWTWRLGEAVLNQQGEVVDAVAQFRERARIAGNLRSDERQVVSSNDGVVHIRPADPRVIYVPYYEPSLVTYYQPVSVYHYYPRRYPVYYYPYPWGYEFDSPFFWGITSFYSIGFSTHYLHHYIHTHRHHPYAGHHYAGYYYHRRHHDDDYQQPPQHDGRRDEDWNRDGRWHADRRHHGARPLGAERRDERDGRTPRGDSRRTALNTDSAAQAQGRTPAGEGRSTFGPLANTETSIRGRSHELGNERTRGSRHAARPPAPATSPAAPASPASQAALPDRSQRPHAAQERQGRGWNPEQRERVPQPTRSMPSAQPRVQPPPCNPAEGRPRIHQNGQSAERVDGPRSERQTSHRSERVQPSPSEPRTSRPEPIREAAPDRHERSGGESQHHDDRGSQRESRGADDGGRNRSRSFERD